MFLEKTTRKQQKSLICEFLQNMLQATNDKEQIARSVNSLNEALYEYGASVKLKYCAKTGNATMVES